jgi:hypothetical protein
VQEARAPPTPAVSADAVIERGRAKVVAAVDSGGVVSFIPVVTGPPMGGLTSLKQGPPPGTKVIRSPPADIQAGAHVKEKGQ